MAKIRMACLTELKVPESALKRLKSTDFTKPTMFMDGEPPYKIDFLTHVSRVKFEEAWEIKKETELEGIKVNILHLNHLVVSKMGTGRPQDKVDIDELQRVQKLKKKKK